MPQPTVQQVHVQAALTNVAVAYIQEESFYVADQAFPVVAVEHQADKYFVFSKDDFYRDEAQMRADADESVGGGFNLSQNSYSANVWAYHKDVGGQTRRNADPAVNMDVATTRFCMQKLLIRKDRFFMTNFLTPGVWSADYVASAGGTPGGTTPAFWNDDANGDPYTDLANAQTTILQNTGFEPNTLLMGFPVYQALRKHPLVIDRVKYTTRADASKITPELLASSFDIERLVISKAVYNTSPERSVGSNAAQTIAASTYSFIASKDAILMHTAPAPGIMIPTAGYTFAWAGMSGLNNLGIRIAQIPMPWLGLETIRTEGEMAFDQRVVGSDLGIRFQGIVQ